MSPDPVLLSWTILSPVYESPLTVSSSKTIWSSVLDVLSSCVKPPFTTETFAVAEPPPVPVFVNSISSPITYPEPPSSITNCVISPLPISPTCIIDPEPPPVTTIFFCVL